MDALKKEDGESLSIVEENIKTLKAMMPDAFTEDGIDFDVLRQFLGDEIADGEEKYGLNWHGKKKVRKIALTPSTGALRPAPQDSNEWNTSKNLFIEGDNLEVLKLLQRSYAGRITTIYIDPPYNTGNELIYPDQYQETLDTYLRYTGQKDSEGLKITSNVEAGGRYHTNWMKMMYPRLKLAKSLLADDGVICVSISDIELANLRAMLEEIFGSENFVNIISVLAKVSAGASGGGEDKRLKKNIEYVVIFAKNLSEFNTLAHLYKNTPLMDVISDMRDAGESWKYTSILLDADKRVHLGTVGDGDGNPIEVYKRAGVRRTTINKVCREEGLSEEEAYTKYLPKIFSDTNAQTSIRTRVIDFVGNLDDNEMLEVEYVPRSGKDKGKKVTHSYISNTVRRVIWLSDVAEVEDGKVQKLERLGTYWDHFDYNNVGKEGGVPFPEGKKPISLIQQCLDLRNQTSGLILDFFAGSGSTAHATMAQNIKDGGDRRYILVQLPEPISEKKEYDAVRKFAEDAGLDSTASALARERIRRAAAELKKGYPDSDIDFGFKVFRLDSSNIRAWNPDASDLEQTLLDHAEHLVEGRSEQDLLYELLLKRGVDLTVPIEEKEIAGKTVYSIGYGVLFACLDETIDRAEIEALGQGITDWHKKLEPAADTQVVFRDSAFADDIAKTNMTAILEQNGIAHVRSL
ncbi:site-specific DNA-methyltransferase [Hyphococcus formosus]|uniref:site-specific DNA-methyltransferase n=1 Tax=Hyphococcus formosus TaxID=3143534 RepID=UPI00398ADFC6